MDSTADRKMNRAMMPQTSDLPRNVFVYGTLRAGGSNDIGRYVPAPQLVGQACIEGALYDLGDYPGLVLGRPGRVQGEVYRITPPVEAALDRLEGVADDNSGEYLKREIEIGIEGRTLLCLVYEIQLSRTVGRVLIEGGDWLAHLVSRKRR